MPKVVDECLDYKNQGTDLRIWVGVYTMDVRWIYSLQFSEYWISRVAKALCNHYYILQSSICE